MKVIQMIRNWMGQMLLKFSPRPRIGKRKFPFPALSSSKQPAVALWIYFTFGERAKIKAADRRFSIAILDSMDGNTFLFGSAVFCGIWGNALSLSLSLSVLPSILCWPSLSRSWVMASCVSTLWAAKKVLRTWTKVFHVHMRMCVSVCRTALPYCRRINYTVSLQILTFCIALFLGELQRFLLGGDEAGRWSEVLRKHTFQHKKKLKKKTKPKNKRSNNREVKTRACINAKHTHQQPFTNQHNNNKHTNRKHVRHTNTQTGHPNICRSACNGNVIPWQCPSPVRTHTVAGKQTHTEYF